MPTIKSYKPADPVLVVDSLHGIHRYSMMARFILAECKGWTFTKYLGFGLSDIHALAQENGSEEELMEIAQDLLMSTYEDAHGRKWKLYEDSEGIWLLHNGTIPEDWQD